MYACKTFLRVRNGDVASRQGVLGGSWTQLGWLVDTAAVQATVVHMGSTQQGPRQILVGGVGGGMGVTAASCWRLWPRLWLSTAGLAAVAAFVALNGRLGVNQLHSV